MLDAFRRRPIYLIAYFAFMLIFTGYAFTATISAIIAIRLLHGLLFGVVHPAFNTLFVRMGGPQMRGAATSTYLTAWDIGIGVGIVAGSIIAERFGTYHTAFTLGIGAVLLPILTYSLWMSVHKKP